MSKYVVMATWDDVPHLSSAQKKDLWTEIPIYQRDARSKGIPQLGSGAIFPIQEEDIRVDDFEIPIWWPRIYGFDVGWNWTAACWLAWNQEDDIVYVYSTYKRGKAEPPVHAEAIKSRGIWIPGAIDPASAGSSQRDGKKLISEYGELLQNLYPADNTVEAGIFSAWKRYSTGRLKVFKSCGPFFDEFRLYRRDEKGKVVKQNDHIMDAKRYALSRLQLAVAMPDDDDGFEYTERTLSGRNSTTGY